MKAQDNPKISKFLRIITETAIALDIRYDRRERERPESVIIRGRKSPVVQCLYVCCANAGTPIRMAAVRDFHDKKGDRK